MNVTLQCLYTLFEIKRKTDSLILGNFNFVSAFFARQHFCYNKGGNYFRRIGKRREHTRGMIFFHVVNLPSIIRLDVYNMGGVVFH